MAEPGQAGPIKGKRKSYLLRISDDLWGDLNEWASQDFRSVNGQIELILRRAVDERKKSRRETKEKGL
jgi:hypothetical protein